MILILETLMEEILDISKNISEKLGKGFNEKIYQEAICSDLRLKNIKYSKEAVHPVEYNKNIIGYVRSDIILHDPEVVVECKAIDGELKITHLSQIISYMKLTGYTRGLIVNFIQNPSKKLFDFIRIFRESNDIFLIISENINEKLNINACLL